ncbi:hypothetical protein [Mycobacterium hubeiense]|uniref:hypothetical protein n=1 Tax=Mycobacterium hubeiense TaxID=1867256 RepID=UPI001E560ED6|nr:hypothetical protein [Mycobacterium sp. QGD 101]
MARQLARTSIGMFCAVLMMITVAGCGPWSTPSVELTFDDPLEAKLSELSERGQSARLRDLTDFDWDEVHVFYEGDSREHVEEVVGARVFRDKYYSSSGSLMVFEKQAKVVKAVALTGEFVRSGQPGWSSDVVLEPYGLGYLRLTSAPAK